MLKNEKLGFIIINLNAIIFCKFPPKIHLIFVNLDDVPKPMMSVLRYMIYIAVFYLCHQIHYGIERISGFQHMIGYLL
jgi:hypothetical protein